MGKFLLILFLFPFASVSATPLLQAVPCEGYREAYGLIDDGHEVVAVGNGFCIVRYGDGAGSPVNAAGTVELGPANREMYILQSYLGRDWTDTPGTETLARFGDSYIVAVDRGLLATNWAGQFEIRKVFDRTIQPPKGTYDYPPIEENALVREMVNRLYADDYGYILESLVDVTPSRYSLSPEIETATDFIENRFKSYGVKTTRHQYVPLDLSAEYYSEIFWLDGQNGWVAGERGFGWRTRDGGNTWREIPVYDVKDIYFFDNNNGITAGYGGFVTTKDGGSTWAMTETDPLTDTLYDIDFYDDNHGVLCGEAYDENYDKYGICYITADGGKSWTRTVISNDYPSYSVCYRTPAEIWIGGADSWIWKSTDGGQTFDEIETHGIGNRDIWEIEMFNETDGVISGDNRLLAYTEDGGTHWELTIDHGDMDFLDMSFYNDEIGWVCDDEGGLRTTNDSGKTWVDVNTTIDVRGLYATSQNEVWVCGGDFSLAYSEDSGNTWRGVNMPISDRYYWNNVIGEITGTVTPEQIYIICAHYDSISNTHGSAWFLAPGAEDNGSGTAGVMHLAKIMSQYNFASTIRFCCWSGEEFIQLGSEAYSYEARRRGDDICGVYNMDMISYMNDGELDSLIHYNYNSKTLLDVCFEAGNLYIPALTLYASEELTVGSDHESFWDYGYPGLLCIEYPQTWEEGFYPWMHTPEDTYDHLNYDYGVLNVKLGAALIGSLAEPLSGPAFAAGDVYAYPNPARPDTDYVTFANVPEDASIDIYTISGDRVITIYERNLDARWDMCDDNGENVASGVYLYYIGDGNDRKIGKIAILH